MAAQEEITSPRATLARPRGPWLASYLLDRQVVNSETLAPLGRVSDVALDPARGQIEGLTIRLGDDPRGLAALRRGAPHRRKRDGYVAADHIVALDGDVVLVDADPVHQSHDANPLAGLLFLNDICERAILTRTGRSLGVLADILLDTEGHLALGYVVQPTELATETLPLVAEVALAEAPAPVEVEEGEAAPPAYAPPAPKMRLIPASQRVRFGPSVVMLVNEVEPLTPKLIVIAQEASKGGERRGFFRRWRKAR
ncbi:MAG TPA: hypothetical protein VF725_03185 [Ktedonobacterales bacterium]